MSAIGPSNANAAALLGATQQAKSAAQDKDKKAAAQRDRRDAIVQLQSQLKADTVDTEQDLIDQEMPDQGQATAHLGLPETEGDGDGDGEQTKTSEAETDASESQTSSAEAPYRYSIKPDQQPPPNSKPHIDLSA